MADRIANQARAERFNIANVPGYLNQQLAVAGASDPGNGSSSRYFRDVYTPDARYNGSA